MQGLLAASQLPGPVNMQAKCCSQLCRDLTARPSVHLDALVLDAELDLLQAAPLVALQLLRACTAAALLSACA